ncbi:MAG: hypothetical protein AB8B96_05060 [Lysobacterales bacterium]
MWPLLIACSGYLHGLSMALDGSAKAAPESGWFCHTENLLSSVDVLLVLVERAIEKPSVQSLSTVAVLADHFKRNFPCADKM